MLKITNLIVIFATILIVGCGGGAAPDQAPGAMKVISGRIVDGPVSHANIGLDSNYNNQLEASEILTISDFDGNFSFSVDKESITPIIAQGGLDTTIQLPFEGTLMAVMPSKSTTQYITPITTLISLGAVPNDLKSMLNLSVKTDFITQDPMSNLPLLKAGIKIHTLATQLSAATSINNIHAYEKIAGISAISEEEITSLASSILQTPSSAIGNFIHKTIQAIEGAVLHGDLITLQSYALGPMTSSISKLQNRIPSHNLAETYLSIGTRSQILTNSIGMHFTRINSGTFSMFSGFEDSDNLSEHEVTISKDFYIGTYEVTQGQWEILMGKENWPSFDISDTGRGDDYPLYEVSWIDANVFIERLNQMEGTDAYRLPTEAEWEYAAKGGTTGPYYFSANPTVATSYAWLRDNSEGLTHPVGQKLANPWGLYDMLGNVSEWVQDFWSSIPARPLTDPIGPPFSGGSKVAKGGSWSNSFSHIKSSSRRREPPYYRQNNIGFRVLRESR